jgi:hypothetical protein
MTTAQPTIYVILDESGEEVARYTNYAEAQEHLFSFPNHDMYVL